MFGTPARSIGAPRVSLRGRWGIARIALGVVGTVGLLTASPYAVEAQAVTREPRPRWEFLLSSGTVVPTGAQRQAVGRGKLTAAQLSYVARPAVAVTTTLGWARSRDVASVGDPKLDVFTYDIGAEVRASRRLVGKNITFSPFAGAGAGARSYKYRSLHVDATHNAAAYVSVGNELGRGRIRLRLEARDYLTGFKPLDGRGSGETRNDVILIAGLRLVAR